MPLSGDGVNLPRLCQCGRHPELNIVEEGFDGSQPSVSRGRRVAAFILDVGKEGKNQLSIHLLDAQL
jgi:hypothetical protein